MDILDENNDHIDIEVLYGEQVTTYNLNQSSGKPEFSEEDLDELTPQMYELVKEAELNLSDELAELNYEGNPRGVIQFLNHLTGVVVKFNSKVNEFL